MMAAKQIQSSKSLAELLAGLLDDNWLKQTNLNQLEVTGVCLDSRTLQAGDLFFACAGSQQHGARYIPEVVNKGATAILIDADYELDLPKPDIPLISVTDLTNKVGIIAHRFYAEPSSALKVTGITGTNGKTSVAWFIAQALSKLNQTTAYMGTIGSGLIDNLQASINTTPDVVTVHRTLAEYKSIGVEHAVMEVSSHGLEQGRVKAVEFDSVIFTNLSRDHLDYHGSMQAYAEAKAKLFNDYVCQYQIINVDDEFGQSLIKRDNSSHNVYSYGLNKNTITNSDRHIYAHLENSKNGFIHLKVCSPWGEDEINTTLLGNFNAYNLLASLSYLCLSGIQLSKACKILESVAPVPGRMEIVSSSEQALVVVDYAHTPDALAKALSSLKSHCIGKMICVFGCGGDRDQGKRSEMGKAATQHADKIILTNDNPRHEEPKKIIDDIAKGIAVGKSVRVLLDRKQAIEEAIRMAEPNDIVLIAGKGHENTQLIGDAYLAFSDQQCAKACLQVKS